MGGEESCPDCGFCFGDLNKRYPKEPIKMRRITDHAGVLMLKDRAALGAHLRELEERICPVLLTVYFIDTLDSATVAAEALWIFDNMQYVEADFPEKTYTTKVVLNGESERTLRQSSLDPEWNLMLVIDVRGNTASFVWGYQLDNYVSATALNKCILKSEAHLRSYQFGKAVKSIMNRVTRLLVNAGNKNQPRLRTVSQEYSDREEALADE